MRKNHLESWLDSASDISAPQNSRPMKAAAGVGQDHETVLQVSK